MGQSKARSHLILQAVGLLYVAYLMVSLISDYCGGESPLSLPAFCLLMAGMAGAEIALGWWAWRGWRRDQARERAEKEAHEDGDPEE